MIDHININNAQLTEILKAHINAVYGVDSQSVEYFMTKNGDGVWFSGVAVHFKDKAQNKLTAGE